MRVGAAFSPSSFQAMQVQAYTSAQQALEGAAAASAQIAHGNLEPSNVIELKQQSTLYSMNLKLVSIADDMAGQVLNLRA